MTWVAAGCIHPCADYAQEVETQAVLLGSPDQLSDEEHAQLAKARQLVVEILTSGVVGAGPWSVSLAGHTGPEPALLTVSVTQTPRMPS